MAADEVIEALRAGQPVLLPTDTVYGLAASADARARRRRPVPAEGPRARQPVALIAASIEQLFDCLPELREGSGTIVRALLPGPFTLVLPNPAAASPG